MTKKGSLTVVGLGMRTSGQTTPEARSHIENADIVFFGSGDAITEQWLEERNANLQTLADCYAVDKLRIETYREMVRRIVGAVRDGLKVCAAFYGHPGVFVYASHESIRQVRALGLEAQMLPGISCVDCLYADLGVDPASAGMQTYEAMDFYIRPRRFDPHSGLVLLQLGAMGITTFQPDAPSQLGLELLGKELAKSYPEGHTGLVYEMSSFALVAPSVQELPLDALATAEITLGSTLYVPPSERATLDEERFQALGMEFPN